MKNWLLAASLAAVACVYACSDDHDHDHDHGASSGGHTSPYPSCNAITQACHPVDVGEGEIHDCHDLGHAAKSDSDCAPKKDRCLEVCNAAAADAGAEGGTHGEHDGGHEGGH